jgi:hypothetical protein
MASPESPTPAGLSSSQRLHQSLFSPREGLSIKIFEDEAEPELPEPVDHMDVNVSMRTEATASFSSELSEHDSEDDEKDPDEENDPIVHSFGPFGANISGRFDEAFTKAQSFSLQDEARCTQDVAGQNTFPRDPILPSETCSGGAACQV